jgi:hypothetical protein
LLELPAEVGELQILSTLHLNGQVDAYGVVAATDPASLELLVI